MDGTTESIYSQKSKQHQDQVHWQPIAEQHSKPLSLSDKVQRTVAQQSRYPIQSIITQENKEKYFDADNPYAADDNLQEVFSLMRELNRQALANSHLCKQTPTGISFTDALTNSIEAVVKKFKNRAIHYIELGPEPMKTRFILKQLMDQGVIIESYIGVDINPASCVEMKEKLKPLLDEDKIQHRISLFENFNVNDVRHNETPALITMLGFQEGNEEPAVMRRWMSQIASQGDYLLSEMQILDEGHEAAVEKFYYNPLMQRFSRIAFERAFGDIPSEFKIFLIPVDLEQERNILATVMCESFYSTINDGGKNAANQIFVTNYCLKYTADHYRQHREHDGQFKIRNEIITDDKSVVFQLSERL